MTNETPVSKFFGSDYIAFASYDGVRKIASYIDGLKPTARKVVFTVMDLNINQTKKVDSIKSKVADHTEYIHGQDTIEGVIVNIAQDFVGAMNIPLMLRDGSFGNRLIPAAAASRYIRTAQEPYLKSIFRDEDTPIIGNQLFEGVKIEPKFFVPIMPMLLVNGSEGIAVGYAQKILPRDPKKLMQYIFGGLKDESLLMPYYEGFKGNIIKTDEKSFAIYGVMDKVNTTTYEIKEVPVGYTYSQYIKVLDKLSDSGSIQSYKDLCDFDKDEFKIVVKVRRDTHNKLEQMSQEERLEYFKLVKRVTENYTCLNENSQIQVFSGPAEIIRSYCEVRCSYYEERKKHTESEMLKKMLELKSKVLFIDAVRKDNIDVKNAPKHDLIECLENWEGIVTRNESFDYLLNMPLWSINEDSLNKIIAELKKIGEEYKAYQSLKISTIWKREYKEFEKTYAKS